MSVIKAAQRERVRAAAEGAGAGGRRPVMPKKGRQAAGQLARLLLLLPFAVLMLAPVVFLLSGSIMSAQELQHYLEPILGGTLAEWSNAFYGEGRWKLLPDYPTLWHYWKLLFLTPQFLVVFWNSVKLTAVILAGQLLIAVPSAWAFAVYRFRGRSLCFTIYIVLMLMPFQVTMLSQYLVLDHLGVMDTHLAIILPAVFSTFPVFLMYRGFREIPRGLLEAGRIDGAGEWYLFRKVGLPLASGKVQAAMVLGFLEYWGMIEQPLAFLKNPALWPLSLYLPTVEAKQAGTAFVASVITLIPAVFVFLLGQDYLEQGIAASGLKE